jgi:hypothetical protein
MTNKMVFSNKNKTIFATLILALSASAQGATSWDFTSQGGWDSSQTYTSGSDSVTVESYIRKNNRKIKQGLVYSWSHGLGAAKPGKGSWEYKHPQHAVDNKNYEFEAILFDFGADNLFAMDSVSVGWYENDSDLSVIALTDESMGGANLGNLKWPELLSNGWDDVAQLCDVGIGTANFNNDANPDNNVYARYWLVGAHNPALHNVAMSCDKKSKTGSCTSKTSYWDAVKISGVRGSYRKSPPGGGGQPVPEPVAVLMMTLGLGFVGTRRKLFRS